MERLPIAIVGAGFSGTLLALNLLRHRQTGVRIRLIERGSEFGPGLAYSTDYFEHRLNVPAGRMSAFPDRPLDFLDWLKHQPDSGIGGLAVEPGSFVPRRLYGAYLRNLLADAERADTEDRLERVRGDVVAITHGPNCLTLHFDDGRSIDATCVVIASGNDAPIAPFRALQGMPFYHNDPWAQDNTAELARDRAVLLIGTGLTMVDTAQKLLNSGHTGPIHALSRRGLLPRTHARVPPLPPSFEACDVPRRPADLLRFIRLESERISASGGSWHAVIDALRPITQDIWRDWSLSERRGFLVHARPWWDAFRHRMAPSVADRIDAARKSGQLQIHAGRLSGIDVREDDAEISWRPRRTAETATLRVTRVINCTGPGTDVTRSTDPLIRSLLSGGLARPDPLGLGFDIANDGAFAGPVSDTLLAIGPLCRGASWESTAVPEIRAQCEKLAHRIADLMRRHDWSGWATGHLSIPHAALIKLPGMWF